MMVQRAAWVPILVYIILGGPESSFCLRQPSEVFTLEMSVIFVALIQIRARRHCRYLIVTNSMSSFKALQTRKVTPRTHSSAYEIKEPCCWLKNNGYDIHMMWIPSHVVVKCYERADQLAGDALENSIHLFDFLIFFLCLG
jgi:hypothetical protein